MARRLSEVAEGDEVPVREFLLTHDQVRAYARAADMWSPRFTDEEGARGEGLPGMIAPGNMTLGLLAGFVEGWAGSGSLRRIGTTFRGLVRPGATIRLCAAVTEKDVVARTAELDLWLESLEGDRLVIGTATVVLE